MKFSWSVLLTRTSREMPTLSVISATCVRRHPVDPTQAVTLLGERAGSSTHLTRPNTCSGSVVAPSACRIATTAGASLLRGTHVLWRVLGATLTTLGRPVHALAVWKGGLETRRKMSMSGKMLRCGKYFSAQN